MGGEEGEGGPDGAAAALRKVPTADPSRYPEYEPTLMAAQQRLNQRRRAEDALGSVQVRRCSLESVGTIPVIPVRLCAYTRVMLSS